MISRDIAAKLISCLDEAPVVSLLGPRQCGKTTLARQVTARKARVRFFDLENPRDQLLLEDPLTTLRREQDALVIIDEVQLRPDLFPILRVLVDEHRQPSRFLLLGSASPTLRRQSAESLAGRILHLELTPLLAAEATPAGHSWEDLWGRGGLPPSFLATNEEISFRWRQNYLRDLVERDMRLWGIDILPERMWRFLRMLAHVHGQLWNASQLARSLDLGVSTVDRYLDALETMFLVRRLTPFFSNLGKRLRKSPKVYLRDTGLLHLLLGLKTRDDVSGHPILGFSWEGFVLEQLVAALPDGWEPSFWRTAGGAEIDLILLRAGDPRVAVEIKTGAVPRPSRGFHDGRKDLNPPAAWVVYPGEQRMTLGESLEALPLMDAVAATRKLV